MTAIESDISHSADAPGPVDPLVASLGDASPDTLATSRVDDPTTRRVGAAAIGPHVQIGWGGEVDIPRDDAPVDYWGDWT